MKPISYFQQLKGAGSTSETTTIDITSSNRKASFTFDGIDQMIGRMFCYVQAVWVIIRTQVDQPAASGSIIRPDQLYRILSSIKLKTNDLGFVYNEGDLSGAALGLIAQVIGGGYQFPQELRADIPAADGDTAITIPIRIPIAQDCFYKSHQTGQWSGFFRNGGLLEVNLGASTALAAVSTGAALEATTDVRAFVEMTAEPEARISPLWVWRQYETPANQKKHTLRGVCQGSGIKNPEGRGKVAFMAWLTDQNGLGGADGADELRRVSIPSRDQESQNLDAPFYGAAPLLYRFLRETRHRCVYPQAQGQQYPFALGTAVNTQPNVATALFVPLFWPDAEAPGQEVSALQEWGGDYNVEFDYGTVPSLPGQWLTLECSYWSQAQEDALIRRMGIPPEAVNRYVKVKGLKEASDDISRATQEAKLRGLPQKLSF